MLGSNVAVCVLPSLDSVVVHCCCIMCTGACFVVLLILTVPWLHSAGYVHSKSCRGSDPKQHYVCLLFWCMTNQVLGCLSISSPWLLVHVSVSVGCNQHLAKAACCSSHVHELISTISRTCIDKCEPTSLPSNSASGACRPLMPAVFMLTLTL